MLRAEFIERITEWDELIQFGYSEGAESVLDDIYTVNDVSDYVESNLLDLARQYTWEELKDVLENVPTDDNYYRLFEDSDVSFVELDMADFETYKEEVLDFMDHWNAWDEEDEEDEAEPLPDLISDGLDEDTSEIDIDTEYTVGQEDISINELFSLDDFDIEKNQISWFGGTENGFK